jgi:hypothetical protein
MDLGKDITLLIFNYLSRNNQFHLGICSKNLYKIFKDIIKDLIFVLVKHEYWSEDNVERSVDLIIKYSMNYNSLEKEIYKNHIGESERIEFRILKEEVIFSYHVYGMYHKNIYGIHIVSK